MGRSLSYKRTAPLERNPTHCKVRWGAQGYRLHSSLPCSNARAAVYNLRCTQAIFSFLTFQVKTTLFVVKDNKYVDP